MEAVDGGIAKFRKTDASHLCFSLSRHLRRPPQWNKRCRFVRIDGGGSTGGIAVYAGEQWSRAVRVCASRSVIRAHFDVLNSCACLHLALFHKNSAHSCCPFITVRINYGATLAYKAAYTAPVGHAGERALVPAVRYGAATLPFTRRRTLAAA